MVLISLLSPIRILLLLFWGTPKDTLLCLCVCVCAEHVLQCCEVVLGVLRHGACGLELSGQK